MKISYLKAFDLELIYISVINLTIKILVIYKWKKKLTFFPQKFLLVLKLLTYVRWQT